MREIRTSGSVGGEGGNILTYPADFPVFRCRSMRATASTNHVFVTVSE